MVDTQEPWVKKLFPELKPGEVEQVKLNLEEFLNCVLDVVIQTTNKSENDHSDKTNL